MAFERFIGSRGFSPRLSVRRGGQIGLNQGAVKRFGLEAFVAVVLFYDDERKMVGLMPTTNKDDPGARRLRVKNGTASISARAFCDCYQIQYEKTRSYPVGKGDDGMIVAELKGEEDGE